MHGEYTFLQAHAGLARECGVQHTSVIHDGQLLGVYNLRNNREVSRSSATLMGEASLRCFYNDGGNATGDNIEQRLAERLRVADQGIVIVSVQVCRAKKGWDCAVEVQCRCMYTQRGEHVRNLRTRVADAVRAKLPQAGGKLTAEVKQEVGGGARRAAGFYAQKVMKKRPDVYAFVHEVVELEAPRRGGRDARKDPSFP